MLLIKGELRRVIDDSYHDKKTGELHKQAVLVIEPESGRQNYEVKLTRQQCKTAGMLEQWESLRGKIISVAVSLYVNHDYKFHRFTALSAKPEATST